MTYENFITEIKERVACLCPNDRVTIEKVTKNNSTVKEAIVVHREGECISPTIYLRDFYFEYMNGGAMNEIADEIVRISENGRGKIDFDIKACQDFSRIKDRLLCKLINAERNEEMLKKSPHRRFLDFALVYYCVETNDEEDFGTWTVNNSVYRNWDVDEDTLYNTARLNLSRLMPPELMKMSDVIKILTDDDFQEQEESSDEIKMYVLSNSKKIYGATSILCGDILRKFAEEHGNFYILPSSIHEVILISCVDVQEPDKLKSMVEDVNTYHVAKEEYLADEVYFYTIDDQEIHRLII